MYGCGDNSVKQLSNSQDRNFLNFVKLSRGEIENNTKIVSVRAGDRFSLALTETGEIFFWGRNIGGVFLNEFNHVSQPKQIIGTIRKNIIKNEMWKFAHCSFNCGRRCLHLRIKY